MKAENAQLHEENDNKLTVLDHYYQDVFEKSSNNNFQTGANINQAPSLRQQIDLNVTPPSELAMDGALIILKTMTSQPVEFTSGQSKVIDFFDGRPHTKFSTEVATLQFLGLEKLTNPEHAFFLSCYMRFRTDASYAENGSIDNSMGLASLPIGGAFSPRASVVQKIPKQFRKVFLSQQSSNICSKVSDGNLNLQPGGGLESHERLPKEIHALMLRFMQGNFYKNSSVALISQFLVYIQNGLTDLDEKLLRYISPVQLQSMPSHTQNLQKGEKGNQEK